MKTAPLKSRVYTRGQMVIPKVLRERLGLRPGQTLSCWEDHGRLVVAKERDGDPLAAVRGVLRMRETVDEYIDAVRGRVDDPTIVPRRARKRRRP